MAKQFLRKVSVKVGAADAIDLSDMHFRFEVKRGDIQTPASADITVYNLADNTSKQIQAEFQRVVIEAGYEGNYGKIFDGTVRQVRRGKENATDKYVNILASDGDFAYNYAYVNTSLAAGATPADQINAAAQAMVRHGVQLGYVGELPSVALPRGKVMYGMARRFLRQITESTDCSWSIEHGVLQVIPKLAYKAGEIPELTANTGLVGLPVQTQDGIYARCLLNPGIKIGMLVHIDNKLIQQFKASLSYTDPLYNASYYQAMIPSVESDGYYKVFVADHTGDSRGNHWYTDMILLGTSPGVTGAVTISRRPA
jgi:hypothetical protein